MILSAIRTAAVAQIEGNVPMIGRPCAIVPSLTAQFLRAVLKAIRTCERQDRLALRIRHQKAVRPPSTTKVVPVM
jgi:hypothetical protein